MIVDSAHYKDGERQHEETLDARAGGGAQARRSERRVRLDRDPRAGGRGPEGPAELFGLHELAVEDASQAHQRPKIEDYGQDVFLVLKTAHYHEDREIVHFGEIHVFAGPGYVITVRHGAGQRAAHGAGEARDVVLICCGSGPRPRSGRSSTRSSTTTSP